jgi:hypothetical protein
MPVLSPVSFRDWPAELSSSEGCWTESKGPEATGTRLPHRRDPDRRPNRGIVLAVRALCGKGVPEEEGL